MDDTAMEEMLAKAEKDARENLHTDVGHLELIIDLSGLLREATDCEFHDTLNQKYPAPKMALHDRLQAIARNVLEGKYDN